MFKVFHKSFSFGKFKKGRKRVKTKKNHHPVNVGLVFFVIVVSITTWFLAEYIVYQLNEMDLITISWVNEARPEAKAQTGTNYYIDPTYTGANGPEDGSFTRPYNSWNDFTIQTGKDYRQKCGTTYNSGSGFVIAAQGTADNRIIIGAYYNNGGVPFHEDNSPSMGKICGNGAAKPIITANAKRSGNAILINGSDAGTYIEFNSISAQKGYGAIRVKHADNNIVRYCYLYDSFWGVELEVSDYNLVEYNIADLNHTGPDENADTDDPFEVRFGHHNIIRYNHATGYDHIAFTVSGGLPTQYNEIIGNYAYKTKGTEDAGLSFSTVSYNTAKYNFFNNVGVAFQIAGKHNTVMYNTAYIDFESNYSNFSLSTVASCCHAGCDGYAAASDNYIIGNTIYQGSSGSGVNNQAFGIYEGTDETLCADGDINKNNYIINNIFYKSKADARCIGVSDAVGDMVGTNYFYNNQCYGYQANYYAKVLGTTYATANNFNGLAFASGNQEGDPKLTNPSGRNFALQSTSPCINKGSTTGANYNNGLNTASAWNPVSILTLNQDNYGTGWEIGAYVYSGTCTPACTGKVCGGDGCGGSCGTCVAPATCNLSGQCVTTGDTVNPIVTAFDVQPRISSGSVTATYTATDNAGLSKIELYRAPYNASTCNDISKTVCAWSKIKETSVSGLSTSGTFTDTPVAGTFWYGLHALDTATPPNIGYQPNPPGPIKVTVSAPATSLSVGLHTITLTATDQNGNTTEDSIQIEILPLNSLIAQITLLDTEYTQGDTIYFTSSVSGGTSPYTFSWKSDKQGVFSSQYWPTVNTSTWQTGTHLITLTATDSTGKTATDQISITINPPSAVCGDGVCNGTETCTNCPADCGSCTVTCNYYIKNTGNDSSDGKSDATAWKTIAKINGFSFPSGATICFKRDGLWREQLTVPASNLTFSAYGTGAKPVISGADLVTSTWTQDSGNVYYTNVSGTVYQVFRNGQWVHLSHEPDGYGKWYTDDVYFDTRWQVGETGDDMIYTSAQILNATLINITAQWQKNVYKINNYDSNAGVIYLANDGRNDYEGTWSNNLLVPNPNRYWLANKRIFLDIENEWFHDSGTGRLYVYQPGGGAPSGSWEIIRRYYGIYAQNRDNIVIRDIEVRNTLVGAYFKDCLNFDINSNSFNDIGTQTYIPGWDSNYVSIGVYINGSLNRSGEAGKIMNNNFNNILRESIVGRDNNNVDVIGNIITNSAMIGEDIGFGPHGGSNGAIHVKFANDSPNWLIKGNNITNCGYIGIYPVANNIVEGNTIIKSMMHMGDGGAIYAGADSPVIIKDNYIDTTGSGGYGNTKTGIYLDSANSDCTITDNIIKNAEFCLFNHGGSRNNWSDNTCIDYSDFGFYSSPALNKKITGLVVKNNKFTSNKIIDQHIMLRTSYTADTGEAPHAYWFASPSDCDYNAYYPDGAVNFAESYPPVWKKTYNLSGWRTATGLDSHSLIQP